jgi:hypothetical protein
MFWVFELKMSDLLGISVAGREPLDTGKATLSVVNIWTGDGFLPN